MTKYNELIQVIEQRKEQVKFVKNLLHNKLREDVQRFLEPKGFEVVEILNDYPVMMWNQETFFQINTRVITDTFVLIGVDIWRNRYHIKGFAPIKWFFGEEEFESFFEKSLLPILNYKEEEE